MNPAAPFYASQSIVDIRYDLKPDWLGAISRIRGRSAVVGLEREILQLPQLDIPVRHLFGKGVYVRSGVIPRGTVATGRIHKFDHVCIIAKGEMTFWTEFGGAQRVTGPWASEIKAGSKRAMYAHEDTHMLTAHGCADGLTGEEMFDLLTVETYEEFEQLCKARG